MIFVTVGTHEQPFNRLIREIDLLKGSGIINESVIVQSGYSTYKMKFCKQFNFLSYKDMVKNVKLARIVITHGGPASFIMAFQVGKVPVVVPRQKKYGEHVNNHQVDFTKKIFEIKKNILPVYDIKKLKNVIINYDKFTQSLINEDFSNNAIFVDKFSDVVDHLFTEVKS